MGSSLMGVNSLKKKLKKAGVQVQVVHTPVRGIPPDAALVVVHRGLARAARERAPQAVVVAFNHFLNDPAFDALVQAFAGGADIVQTE